jgi:hypothetical protein
MMLGYNEQLFLGFLKDGSGIAIKIGNLKSSLTLALSRRERGLGIGYKKIVFESWAIYKIAGRWFFVWGGFLMGR